MLNTSTRRPHVSPLFMPGWAVGLKTGMLRAGRSNCNPTAATTATAAFLPTHRFTARSPPPLTNEPRLPTTSTRLSPSARPFRLLEISDALAPLSAPSPCDFNRTPLSQSHRAGGTAARGKASEMVRFLPCRSGFFRGFGRGPWPRARWVGMGGTRGPGPRHDHELL